MRVYTKKEDKETMNSRIAITAIFLSVSIGIFITAIASGKSFIDVLSSYGIELIFAIISFGFGMVFFYALIKSPKGYKAKLVNKKIDIYNNKQITYMEFSTQKERELEEDPIPSDYKCYTIGENNLIVGKEYSLKIKECNWEPKYVEEINNSYESTKNIVTDKVPNMTMFPLFLSIGLFLVGLLGLCILGIIKYPQYKSTYIGIGIFSGVGLVITFMIRKVWRADNIIDQNEQDLNLELEKIKAIDIKQEKVGNTVIKQLFTILVVLSVSWFLIILGMNIKKELLIPAYSTILLLDLPVIIMILYNIKYDKKLIKRHKVNISENINIAETKYFRIFRPTISGTFPQYFVVDKNKNLILKVKKNNLIGSKYVICNQRDIKIGEIELKLFSLTDKFIVNIINEKPFIVRAKMQLHSNYQVIGRDYYIKGDTHLIKNTIYDNKENDIAYISAISKNNNNWHELGNTEVTLNEDVKNSLDIMVIALCVTMGNFQRFDRNMDR